MDLIQKVNTVDLSSFDTIESTFAHKDGANHSFAIAALECFFNKDLESISESNINKISSKLLKYAFKYAKNENLFENLLKKSTDNSGNIIKCSEKMQIVFKSAKPFNDSDNFEHELLEILYDNRNIIIHSKKHQKFIPFFIISYEKQIQIDATNKLKFIIFRDLNTAMKSIKACVGVEGFSLFCARVEMNNNPSGKI